MMQTKQERQLKGKVFPIPQDRCWKNTSPQERGVGLQVSGLELYNVPAECCALVQNPCMGAGTATARNSVVRSNSSFLLNTNKS